MNPAPTERAASRALHAETLGHTFCRRPGRWVIANGGVVRSA